jgi:alkylation response protein AidB-like acyl-CoA dehydrogenase
MSDNLSLDRFRGEVRAWLDENCPPSMRTPATEAEWVWGGRRPQFPSEDARVWLSRMVARGWTAPTWPREYGGGGLSQAEAAVLDEEMRRLGCRGPLKSFGLWMLAPVLFEFGSEAQRREHLPPIARAEIRWCQGYSEPGAGSDLASLSTRAVLDGGEYIVDGQKIWTSHADQSDFMFCLVRTDPQAKKHAGISFLLIDMATPGITVKPIRLISGASPFCETFFEHVRVPARNLVGAPGQGWTIAKALLKHERALIAASRDAATADEEPLEATARRYLGLTDGKLPDAALRDRIAQANIDALCNSLLLKRTAELSRAGQPASPADASLLKYYGTELGKRRRELRVIIAGYQGIGGLFETSGFSTEELQFTRDWLRSRASSIEGGTSEIQLNILARQLGLGDPQRKGDG